MTEKEREELYLQCTIAPEDRPTQKKPRPYFINMREPVVRGEIPPPIINIPHKIIKKED